MVDDPKLRSIARVRARDGRPAREGARGQQVQRGRADDQAFAGFRERAGTAFTGYDNASVRTRVVALATLRGDAPPTEVQKHLVRRHGWVVLEETLLHLQSGGQVRVGR